MQRPWVGPVRFFMALLAFLVLACDSGSGIGRKEGGKAPDFTLRDLDGELFHLKAQRGKMVLVIFTTTWCPACRELIPLYKELSRVYGERGLVIVNADIQEPRERVRRFAETNRIPYRIVLDEDGAIAMGYGVVGIPDLVLINEDGEIIGSDTMDILDMLEKTFPGREPD
ncbi:MAG: redoxin family protein [Syntrophales bacterium]|nr:redoxin family protein [Syntrophales bacterium]